MAQEERALSSSTESALTAELLAQSQDDMRKERLQNNQPKASALAVIAIIAMGFVFGFVFEKSRVFEPKIIQAQFRFEKWLMLKMFLAAMAASALSLILVYTLAIKSFVHVRDAFHGCLHRGILTAIVPGGLLLGAGTSTRSG